MQNLNNVFKTKDIPSEIPLLVFFEKKRHNIMPHEKDYKRKTYFALDFSVHIEVIGGVGDPVASEDLPQVLRLVLDASGLGLTER